MANTIRIKRRSTNATAPSTSEVVNGELAVNEFTAGSEILYYGKGGSGSASSSVLKIGGPGAYLTTDTSQTPTGIKTFSTTTLLITGGSNTNVLTTNGSGAISWSAQAAAPNAFTNFSDGTNTAAADTTSDTFKFRGTAPLTVTVTNDDATHGDSALFAVSAASTSAAGVVQLSDSTSSTSTSVAATANAVKAAYDLAGLALPKAGGTMTSFISLHANPTNDKHAATKEYVDAVAQQATQGLDVKASCRAASTASISLGAPASSVIDGVTIVTGDRVLMKNQSNAVQNGIYVYSSSTGVFTRATDADTSAEVTTGMFTFVSEGTVNADSGWVLTSNDAIVLDTTELAFAQFSGAGQVTAGAGLTKTGNTLDVATANTDRIVVNADSIDLGQPTITTASGSAGINFVQAQTVDVYGRTTSKTTADVRSATTSVTGITSLTDSTSSTSTSTAATPNSVKSAYDLAGLALPKSGGTMTGKVITGAGNTAYASVLLGASTDDPTTKTSGDFWNNTGAIKFYNGTAVKTVAFLDSNITGTAGNVSGTVAVGNGGTGATTFTVNGIIYGNTTSALQVTAAGTWDGTNSVGQLLSVNSSNVPTWTNTLDGGAY
jgi:hypothetical protein